jgi:D-aminopeptidase
LNGFFYISKGYQAIAVAVEKAAKEIERFKPLRMEELMVMELDYANSDFAIFASWIPTVERMDTRTVAFKVTNFYVGFRRFLAEAALPLKYDNQM